ncbi:MAG: hypothetical protein LBV48_00445 [Mycoplasmataceae bacterium]|nr:hypothetical protein [Mycoplasmataceae bacterium]
MFLTFLYSKTSQVCFVKAMWELKDGKIYEEMYFSNYFHDLATKIFNNKKFSNLSISNKEFNDIVDNFWLLMEKDEWFSTNKVSIIFKNTDLAFTQEWEDKIFLFLEQHKIFIKVCNKYLKNNATDTIIYCNKLLNKKN